MDPVSHGLVGAVTAQIAAPSDRRREAAVVGSIAAMVVDLDVFLQRPDDPLFQLEFHRQFSHSLIFVPVGALLVAGLLWYFFRERLRFIELYFIAAAGYISGGLLDACTSYGTQLLWPFSGTRFAWNLIPVVEPLTTLGLIFILTMFFIRRKNFWLWAAVGWVSLALIFGGIQQSRATRAAHGLWAKRGHSLEPDSTQTLITDVVTKPTLGNQVLWRVTYVADGRVYADGVWVGAFSTPRLYPGQNAPLVTPESFSDGRVDTRLYRDTHRFSVLSEDYIIAHPNHPNVVGDARYAMLPNSLIPLWGLEFDLDHPDSAPTFETYRDTSKETRRTFLKMLRGLPIDDQQHKKGTRSGPLEGQLSKTTCPDGHENDDVYSSPYGSTSSLEVSPVGRG